MQVLRGPTNKSGHWTTVLPDTDACRIDGCKGAFRIIFEQQQLEIENLSGRYHVQAKLSLRDVARMLCALADKAHADPQLRTDLAEALAKHDSALRRFATLAADPNPKLANE